MSFRRNRTIGRALQALLTTLALFAGTLACRGSAPRESGARVTAIVGGTIHPSPDAAAIPDGIVLLAGERITAVGPRDSVEVPDDALVIEAAGRTVLAGFWNSHVHFIEPQWEGIDTMPAERASRLLREMLNRFGFVHVFDIASFSDRTLELRSRIASGDVRGPDVRTTLIPFVPPNGTPRYVPPSIVLPELHGPADARDSVRARIAQGADGIKLFTVPITRTRPFPVMSSAVVDAVTDEAHDAGLVVFAHPTNLAGVQVAVEHGVDVLAHTVPMARAIPDSVLDAMLRRGVALIPTLTLWEEDYGSDTTGMGAFMRAAQRQVDAYADRGGRILFGTDVGYIAVYDPTREYELMAGAGLDFRAILTSLTTAPAAAFGRDDHTGRVQPGFDADIVVLDGDPLTDVRALGRVRLAIKRGQIIYDADGHTDGGAP